MSKKHHSKRSCIEDNIIEEKKLDEKKYKKKNSRHKKNHKKHSKKLYEEYSEKKVIGNTISDDRDKDLSEKTTERDYSECDDNYLEDRYDKKSKKVCFEEDFKEHIEFEHIKDHDDIEDCAKSCNAKYETKTLSLCPSTPQTVTGTTRPVVIKTPVVLAEPKVEISTESVLKLEDPVLEIKRIRKNVYVEQCKVIQESCDPNFGTLFLEGFIRKNIEYATRDCCDKGITSGKIKHTTVKIPFTCATRVQFTTLPIFTVTPPPVQVEILQDNIKICNPCEEGISGHNPCQLNLRLSEFFNEKVYCELVSAEIVESDFLEEPTKENFECILDKTYRNVREKVVVNLTIKLLQNQQVAVNRANTE